MVILFTKFISIFSFLERKVLFFQYSIFSCNSFNRIISIKNKQKIIIKNLSCRFKVVRDLLFESNSYGVLDFYFFTSSFLFFQIVFSLRKQFLVRPLISNYILKIKGYSNSFELQDFYCSSLKELWNLYFIPLTETFSDRFSFSFRPFRNNLDLISSLRKRLNDKYKKLDLVFLIKFSLLIRHSQFHINKLTSPELFINIKIK